MKVVGGSLLDDFAKKHSDATSQISAWIFEVEEAVWRGPKDVKTRYPHASILTQNRIIFNIKGNNYWLEVKVHYATQVVLVKRMGTHAEYSKWNF